MKTHRISDAILILAILFVVAMICAPMAHATGQVDPAAPVANAAAQAKASAAVDMSLMNSATGGQAYGGVGGSVRGGNSYALMGGGTATPLPSGLCPKSDSYYLQLLGGLLFTVAWSSNRTEMECLEKVLQMLRDTAPKPVPLVNYVAPPNTDIGKASVSDTVSNRPLAITVECKAPEPAKPKPAKGKKTAAKLDECKRG